MAAEVVPPIVLDLGKTKRKRIKRLKRGRGRLAQEVHEIVAEVAESLGSEGDDKQLVPVVIIYRRRRKKRAGLPFLW